MISDQERDYREDRAREWLDPFGVVMIQETDAVVEELETKPETEAMIANYYRYVWPRRYGWLRRIARIAQWLPR